MVVKIICLFLAIVSFSPVLGTNSQDSYVQWVNYTGEVPDNAVPGGLDVNNNVEYIGRVFYSTDLSIDNIEGYFPGAIKPGVESIDIIVNQDPLTVTEGIQILVANKSTELEWKTVNYYEFPELLDDPAYHAIMGGFELHVSNYHANIYLGRVKHNGSDILGNILTSSFEVANKILFYLAEGEVHEADNYDALVYYF